MIILSTPSPSARRQAARHREWDKTVRLWDAATGKELQRLSHDNTVNAVTFSPDGKPARHAELGQYRAALGRRHRQGIAAAQP